MAKQVGPMKITGTLGNMIYFRKGNNFFVKLKPHVDPKKITHGVGYDRQRANMLEFGHASKASKLIFLAFANSHRLAKDANIIAHLVRDIHKVIKSDKENEFGKRNITDGETSLMEGFEFNENTPLRKVLLSQYAASIDTNTGIMQVTLQELELHKMVKAPKAATHFTVQLAASAIDFVNTQHVSEVTCSPELSLKEILPAQLTLTAQLPPNQAHPHFLALRIFFLQEHNGVIKPLNTIVYNAMAFVKVHSV